MHRKYVVVHLLIMFLRSIRAFRSVGWRTQSPHFLERRIFSLPNDESGSTLLTMENLYQEWTIEQDRVLWKNRDKSTIELATMLGRGLNGVKSRLMKLKDVDSKAYERLFSNKDDTGLSKERDKDYGASEDSKTKLVPAGQILQRIEFDYMLSSSDFSLLHYDRLDDKVIESPFDAPNESIAGGETSFAKALPEHRIVGIKYKERVVWDRSNRIDLVTSSKRKNEESGGIYEIIETYDEWKRERDQVMEWNRQRQKLAAQRMRQILGLEYYSALQESSSSLLEAKHDATLSAIDDSLLAPTIGLSFPCPPPLVSGWLLWCGAGIE